VASLTVSYSALYPDVDAITLPDFNSLICSFLSRMSALGWSLRANFRKNSPVNS